MKKFTLKPRIVFDKDAVSYLCLLEEKRFFVIADHFLVKNKMISRVTDQLGERDFKIYSNIIPDPPVEIVAQCIKEIMDYNPDCVIAVGGGSAIDTAKAVIYYGKSSVRFVAVPTRS